MMYVIREAHECIGRNIEAPYKSERRSVLRKPGKGSKKIWYTLARTDRADKDELHWMRARIGARRYFIWHHGFIIAVGHNRYFICGASIVDHGTSAEFRAHDHMICKCHLLILALDPVLRKSFVIAEEEIRVPRVLGLHDGILCNWVADCLIQNAANASRFGPAENL